MPAPAHYFKSLNRKGLSAWLILFLLFSLVSPVQASDEGEYDDDSYEDGGSDCVEGLDEDCEGEPEEDFVDCDEDVYDEDCSDGEEYDDDYWGEDDYDDYDEEGDWDEESKWNYYEGDEGGQEDNGNDEDYFERELENIADNLEWIEDSQKDLEREYKRVERLIKEYDRELEDLEDERRWFEEDGWDTAPVDDYEALLRADKEAVNHLLGEFDPIASDFSDALAESEEAYNDADEETVNLVWLIINKAQLVMHQLDTLRGDIDYFDTVRGFYDWNFETALLQNDFADVGLEMSSDVEDAIKEAASIQDEYEAAYQIYRDLGAELETLVAGFPDYSINDLVDNPDFVDELWDLYEDYWDASEDRRWAQEDAWYITDDLWDMWEIFDEAWEEISFGNDMQWILEDIAWLREDLDLVAKVFEMLQDKVDKVKDSDILEDVEEVLRVKDQARVMLDDIEEMAEDVEDPQDLEDAMMDLESLGAYIEPRIDNVMDYIEDHENDFTDEEKALIEEFISMEEEGSGQDAKRFQEAYGSDIYESFEGYLGDADVDALIDLITKTVMEALAQNIDSDLATIIVEKLMANLEHFRSEKFGSDFTTQMLENGNAVYAKMRAVDFEALEGLDAGLERDFEKLYQDFQNEPIVDEEVAQKCADFWGDVATTIAAEPTENEIEGILEDGQALLEEIEIAKYEKGMDTVDVPGYLDDDFNDVWYAEAVMDGWGEQWNGYMDPETGEPTYTFGPSNTALRAEMLKMVLSAYGYKEIGSGSNWWSGWENKGKELGVSLEGDLSQPITRGEAFRLIFEVAKMDSDTYQAYFSDVDVLDDYAPVEALFRASLVTGQGGNYANLEGTLNRAESAVLIQRILDHNEEQEFEDTLVSYGESDFDFGEFLARLGRFFRSILPANLFNW